MPELRRLETSREAALQQVLQDAEIRSKIAAMEGRKRAYCEFSALYSAAFDAARAA